VDTLLAVIAVISFAAAIGFGIVAWRALDDQRRRSAARVASLSAAIHADTPATPVAVGSLFDRPSGASVQGLPLIKGAVVGVLGVALIVFVTIATSDDAADRTGAVNVRAAAAVNAPLELMTMKHTRSGDALTITGLVRNPASGAQVSHISAVVFAYDRDGTFAASAQAPLDFTVLAPGDESPFVVTLKVADVSKYRVSFRTDAGTLRHVDRRAATPADDARGALSASRRAQLAQN
jgi:hypothetical protein